MLPYWLLFGFYAAGAVFHKTGYRDARRMSPLMWLGMVATALMIGLRYKVGADWLNYIEIFRLVGQSSRAEILALGDPSYMGLNALAQHLGVGIWFVNLACAIIFVAGLAAFAQGQPNPWLTVAVGIPYLTIVVVMGYTRQGAAIGVVLLAICAFQEQRYLKFLFLILFAASFHKSAVAVLPIVALSSVRHRFAIYAVATMFAILLFSIFLDRFLDAFAATYISSEMSSSGAGIRIAMNVVPATLFLFNARRFVTSEQEFSLWRNFALLVFATVVGLALLPSTAVDRIALYLIPLQLFVLGRLPYAFPNADRRNDQLLVAVLLYCVAVQVVWLVFATHAEYWLPYRAALA